MRFHKPRCPLSEILEYFVHITTYLFSAECSRELASFSVKCFHIYLKPTIPLLCSWYVLGLHVRRLKQNTRWIQVFTWKRLSLRDLAMWELNWLFVGYVLDLRKSQKSRWGRGDVRYVKQKKAWLNSTLTFYEFINNRPLWCCRFPWKPLYQESRARRGLKTSMEYRGITHTHTHTHTCLYIKTCNSLRT